MAKVYRPRWLAFLTVSKGDAAGVVDETDKNLVTFPVKVQRFSLTSNDFNHADELSITADWRDCGIDPRLLRNATVTFHIDDANDDGEWEPTDANLRFVGLASRVQRHASEGEALKVEIEALDFTTLFLHAKPFGTDGIPDYSQTLDQAWRRIVSQTPGASVLANKLELEGLSAFPVLGKAVASRFAKRARVPVHPDTDAWTVWLQTCGMCGLITWVDRYRVVVATATNYYSSQNPAALVWGRNILELVEERNPEFSRKGVGLTSFDSLTGRAIEGVWPPVGDKTIKRKGKVTKKGGEAALRASEERDWFPYPYGVTDIETLTAIAQRTYEERSRQELQGSLKTTEMVVDKSFEDTMDLLELRAGDDVRVDFNQTDKELLAAIPAQVGAGGEHDYSARIAYLKSRGFAEGVAELIAASADDFLLVNNVFLTKRVTVSGETTPEGGSFNVEIGYCNRIKLTPHEDE